MSDSITSSIEYGLSSLELQHWADVQSTKIIDLPEALKAANVKIDTISVECNDDEYREIKVTVNFFKISPSPEYKKVKTVIDKKHIVAYMIKGGSPLGKTSIWFSEDAFMNSPDLAKLKKQIDSAFRVATEKKNQDILEYLRKNLSKTAVKAAEELPAIAKADGTQGVFKWFKKNKFDLHNISPDHFKGLVDQLKKHGTIVNRWVHDETLDGWGHREGKSVDINWDAKKVYLTDWSST